MTNEISCHFDERSEEKSRFYPEEISQLYKSLVGFASATSTRNDRGRTLWLLGEGVNFANNSSGVSLRSALECGFDTLCYSATVVVGTVVE